jgi:hypothetical protein
MAKKMSSSDVLSHSNAVRARIIGEGNLRTILTNTGEAASDSSFLADVALTDATSKSINQLANFKGEKIAVEIRVCEENEWFKLSNLWVYVKQTSASYPQ